MSAFSEQVAAAVARQLTEGDGVATEGEPNPQDLGWLGVVFGARYANTNIVGLVVTASILMLFGAAFGLPGLDFGRELLAGIFSLLSLALGYLFGSKTRS